MLRFDFCGNNKKSIQITLLVKPQAVSLLTLYVPQCMRAFFNDAGKDKSEPFEKKFSIMFPLIPRLLHH